MKRGGGAPLIGVGVAGIAVVAIIAVGVHDRSTGTGCPAIAVESTVLVKVSGQLGALQKMQLCVGGSCTTAAVTSDASVEGAPAAEMTPPAGPGSAADTTLSPQFSVDGSNRPNSWLFDLGSGEPSPITVTALTRSGHVLVSEVKRPHWSPVYEGAGCRIGAKSKPLSVNITS